MRANRLATWGRKKEEASKKARKKLAILHIYLLLKDCHVCVYANVTTRLSKEQQWTKHAKRTKSPHQKEGKQESTRRKKEKNKSIGKPPCVVVCICFSSFTQPPPFSPSLPLPSLQLRKSRLLLHHRPLHRLANILTLQRRHVPRRHIIQPILDRMVA